MAVTSRAVFSTGKGGNDTLRLIGPSSEYSAYLDFSQLAVFGSFETIVGSAASDSLSFKADQLSDVKVFDGNGASLWDTLRIYGSSVNLQSKTFIDFGQIYLHTDNVVVTANSWAVASLIDGRFAQNDRLIVNGFTLSDDQRKTLHARGIDTIENAGVPSTDAAPTFSNVEGDRIVSTVGSRLQLDRGGDGVISDNGDIIRCITVSSDATDGWGGVVISKTDRVSFTSSGAGGSVYVDDVLAGTYEMRAGNQISFSFNTATTSDRASAILHSLAYWNSYSGSHLSHGTTRVTISAADSGNRISKATVYVENANDAPVDITFGQPTVAEGAASGTYVGDIYGADYNAGDKLTFTLVDDAGGRFALSASGAGIVVKNGSAIDYETARSHTITIRATDLGGLWIERTFTINVGDVASESSPGRRVVGSSGKDTLAGGTGDDQIAGKGGNDRLTGNAGKDSFIFDSKLGSATTDRKVNFDTITDFDRRDDRIHLDNGIFKKLGKVGQLNKSFFVIGSKAKDKNDYILYDKSSGVLSYDVDGSGAQKAVEFAQIKKGLVLSAGHFIVI